MKQIADLKLIEKALKNETGYRIAKDTGVSQSAISRYQLGDSDILNMRLGDAIKLTNYYLSKNENNFN